MQIGHTKLYRDSEIVSIESSTGYLLKCNLVYEVCTFELSGWYFGKTAGLWGTMNNEEVDDVSSAGVKSTVENFAHSWALAKTPRTLPKPHKEPSQTIAHTCKSFFAAKASNFKDCFERVSPVKYLEACREAEDIHQVCSIGIAYMNACAFGNTLMRIPEVCVSCQLGNGTEVKEGIFVKLEDNEVPNSADLVFIVEAKTCNNDLRRKRNMDVVVEQIEKELQAFGLSDNR